MTKEKPKNIAASVRQRLQNIARQRKEDFQLALSRYALERLLHRINQSPHHDRFVVKGALLFHLWTDQIYRPTRDIDFLAYGDHSLQHLENVFREVCSQSVEDDGLTFHAESVAGSMIKPDQEYQGVRIHLDVKLERARIPVQIDIGFGDAIPDEQIVSSLMRQLGWTHLLYTIPLDDPLKRDFYAEMCRIERWSARTLRHKIAHYNATELPPVPDRLPLLMQQILFKRLTFCGFIVSDSASQFPQFLADMVPWINDGKIKYKEDMTDGLENAPEQLIGLLRGENFGKKIIRDGAGPAVR